MKKIISLISILMVALLVTGCGNGNLESKSITCKSEAHGTNPDITSYEKYVVKGNKIEEFEYYLILNFEDSYLNQLPLESIMEVYENDADYSVVEKIDANTLKAVMANPVNVFDKTESDDMIELIRSTLEDNPFNVYKYTCEIE